MTDPVSRMRWPRLATLTRENTTATAAVAVRALAARPSALAAHRPATLLGLTSRTMLTWTRCTKHTAWVPARRCNRGLHRVVRWAAATRREGPVERTTDHQGQPADRALELPPALHLQGDVQQTQRSPRPGPQVLPTLPACWLISATGRCCALPSTHLEAGWRWDALTTRSMSSAWKRAE
jgi:hypothetical protein